MASSYGQDASKSALQSAYEAVSAQIAPRHAERVDREVRIHFTAMSAYREASLVLAYITYRDEFDTTALIERAWKDGKRVAVPVCDRGVLVFYEIDTLEGMRIGSRGVLEPDPAACTPVDPADFVGSICLVPGLVFDGEGNRVGYGAGYYDNFLAYYPGDKIGLVRSVQVSSNPLPYDAGDVAVDVLVTEGTIWRCRKL
jgi:5-formyltetrahydrofolate cyclo-ligase